MNQHIVGLTEKLIHLAEEADSIYETVRKNGEEKDFYLEVKPFADQVKQLCEEWEKEMKLAMKKVTYKHLFPTQIEQAAQNLEDVAIQAFFPKTSYKRFKSHMQSVLFTLNQVRVESKRLVSQSNS